MGTVGVEVGVACGPSPDEPGVASNNAEGMSVGTTTGCAVGVRGGTCGLVRELSGPDARSSRGLTVMGVSIPGVPGPTTSGVGGAGSGTAGGDAGGGSKNGAMAVRSCAGGAG